MNVLRIWAIALSMPLIMLLASAAFAQALQKPVFSTYKGVTIGMPMDDARTKLGTPKDRSDTQDYFVFSDTESCQVLYGPDKTVRLLSINYVGKSAPTPMDVFGANVEAKPDGSMNKVVKFPKSGYSVSYLRTPGDDPVTMITVQKISPADQ
jgi:hypothetical protein